MENNPAITKPQPPEVLYQYRPPTVWAIANLSQRVLYFGSPTNFNDPYDCNIPPRLDNFTDEQHKSSMDEFSQRRNLPQYEVQKGGGKVFATSFNALSPNMWKQERNSFGVACFSRRPDNLLMWSHYSGYGKGFCLAFNTRKAPHIFGNNLTRKVRYSKKYKDILDGNAFRSAEEGVDLLLDFLAHKSIDWKYEKEWRAFTAIEGKNNEERDKERKIDYAPEVLKAVYFGTETDDETKERIRAIVEKTYPNAELWQGELSKTEYKVVFEPMR